MKVKTLEIDEGGCFCPPQGTEFPGTPMEGNLFWRTDEGKFYQYDGSNWLQAVFLDSTGHIHPKIYQQDAEPDIPNNSEAFWQDTDDENRVYHIVDIGGTQYKVELT